MVLWTGMFGDVSVSGVSDTDVSGIDTVVAGAVIGCLCDPDGVSRGDIVVSVDYMSLSGGVDAVVSSLWVVSIRCWKLVSSTCVVLTQWCLVLTSLCVVSTR